MADRSSKAKKSRTMKPKASGSRTHADEMGESPRNDLVAQELLHGLSEKEVEIDHLKTTVVSLNTKVCVIQDI